MKTRIKKNSCAFEVRPGSGQVHVQVRLQLPSHDCQLPPLRDCRFRKGIILLSSTKIQGFFFIFIVNLICTHCHIIKVFFLSICKCNIFWFANLLKVKLPYPSVGRFGRSVCRSVCSQIRQNTRSVQVLVVFSCSSTITNSAGQPCNSDNERQSGKKNSRMKQKKLIIDMLEGGISIKVNFTFKDLQIAFDQISNA